MSEKQPELLLGISKVVAAFNDLGIDYLIGGSVASSVFGEPRQTIDADIVARILGRQAQPLVQKLQGEFYADLLAINSAIQQQSCFNLIHLDTMSKIDVFVRWREPFAQSQFSRRTRKTLANCDLFFATAEDTILSKLEWFQKGGEVSDRQWRDVLGVLKIQGETLDRAYLDHWARELGLSKLLQRALVDAGLECKG